MTIRLSCPAGHSVDTVLDLTKLGGLTAPLFLAKYGDEIAALLDGTSKLYVLAPPTRRCPIPGCEKSVKAKVVG